MEEETGFQPHEVKKAPREGQNAALGKKNRSHETYLSSHAPRGRGVFVIYGACSIIEVSAHKEAKIHGFKVFPSLKKKIISKYCILENWTP